MKCFLSKDVVYASTNWSASLSMHASSSNSAIQDKNHFQHHNYMYSRFHGFEPWRANLLMLLVLQPMQNLSIWAIQICNIHIMKKQRKIHDDNEYHGKKGVEVDGVHCVKCNICNTIEMKPKCLQCKWDNLQSMKACERTKKIYRKRA